MNRLTSAQLREWGQFYLRLVGVNVWNGFTVWAKTTLGALFAQGTGLVDLRAVGAAGAGWILLGTIAFKIAESLFNNQLPEPTKPEART